MTGPGALEALPAGVRTAADYEAHARARLQAQAWDYLSDRAGSGSTCQANRRAWDALGLVPRVLRPVAGLDSHVELLGRRWPSPLLVAPMALQRLAHADGELGMALAAAMQGVGMVLPTQSSVALETVAQAVRGEATRGPLWLQLYLLQDRAATLALVRRAQAAGYEAIVLTVDAALRAARPLQLPADVRAVHLEAGTVFAAPGWDDVAWLQSQTSLPILLKGVLHPQDALEAARLGVAGLVVSNHGGRVLDGAVATAPALARIADAVGDQLPLLVDGGIRSGSDALKALALGARAVLVGRPALHGLAAAGAAGAAHVLRLLRDELELAMAQCGISTPAAATRGLLA
jgi:4-hydroxymandelate oxidase